MKTKFILAPVIAILLLSQSCTTYKYTGINEVKTGKRYVIKLKEGKVIKAKVEGILADSIALRTNENIVKFPKSSIEHIKREKLSVFRVLVGGAIVTTGVIFLLKDAKKDFYLKPFN